MSNKIFASKAMQMFRKVKPWLYLFMSSFFILIMVPLVAGENVAARPAELQVIEDGANFIVENSFYRLTIDTFHGGAIRSFCYKTYDPKKEWIYPKGGGLLEDMIWQQTHPGELQDNPYEYKVLEKTPAIFRLEMWRAFKGEPCPGLMMRKVVTLKADSPAVRVTMTLANPTDKDMFPGAWIQNRFFCGGNKGVQVVYSPSNLGIRMVYVKDGRRFGDEFVRKPAAGWAMTFDQDLGIGLLSLVDYNYLRMHYSCITMYTTEWFYDRVLIQPRREWKTSYTLIPVKNVFNCYYADEQVFVTALQKGETLTLEFRATDDTVKELAVKIQVDKSDRSEKLADVSTRLSNLTHEVGQTVTVPIPGLERNPVIISLTLGATDTRRSTEFLYSSIQALYYAPESASTYRVRLPKKQKPELMGERNLMLQKHQGLSVLYGIGLYHEFNRLPEILRSLDSEVKIKESFFRSSVLGPELSYQPLLAEELLGYDLIILNNVGADALGEAGEIAVSQYVKAGGSLLVCGGLSTLGKGRFDESPLGEVLPIVTGEFFDIERLEKFQLIVAKTDKNAGFGEVQWIQRVKSVKPEAEVLLTADGRPLLVVGQYGNGRVAVWLGTPMGDPKKETIPYWKSPKWLEYMRVCVRNLLPNHKKETGKGGL